MRGTGNDLFDIKYEFLQGKYMEGVVAGGNIRCLLKLAGTEYMPDMTDKILVLENGRAAGLGTHEQLLESCPVYRERPETEPRAIFKEE